MIIINYKRAIYHVYLALLYIIYAGKKSLPPTVTQFFRDYGACRTPGIM